MFASVIGCLSWSTVADSHWSGPACWYTSLVFSICGVLTGAQQTLVLVSDDMIDHLTPTELQTVKQSLASSIWGETQPSSWVLFSWQVPIMLLCYAVLFFLAGLCSVVYEPLSRSLDWNNDSKVCRIFQQGLSTI